MTTVRWYRLGLGAVVVVVPLWILLSRLDAIWNGHPAYPATLLVTIAVGLVLVAFALWPWRRDPEPHGPPWDSDAEPVEPAAAEPAAAEPATDEPVTAAREGNPANGSDPAAGPHPASGPPPPTNRRRRTGWRVVRRVAAAVLVLGWLAVLAWLRPFTAGPDSLAALAEGGSVVVTDNPTTIELAPAGSRVPTTGLVFTPGARVDSRAYAELLRPVAEAGYLIVILKSPYGIAFAQPGQSAGPIADHPEVTAWAVGGHSLGGVVAAGYAGDHADTVTGLLLYASYPNTDLSSDGGLQAESIFGSNDGLTTAADIARTQDLLPPDTLFTVIEGGVHAYFGDYGEQPGDGQSTVSREHATAEIVAATTAFMERVELAASG